MCFVFTPLAGHEVPPGVACRWTSRGAASPTATPIEGTLGPRDTFRKAQCTAMTLAGPSGAHSSRSEHQIQWCVRSNAATLVS